MPAGGRLYAQGAPVAALYLLTQGDAEVSSRVSRRRRLSESSDDSVEEPDGGGAEAVPPLLRRLRLRGPAPPPADAVAPLTVDLEHVSAPRLVGCLEVCVCVCVCDSVCVCVCVCVIVCVCV